MLLLLLFFVSLRDFYGSVEFADRPFRIALLIARNKEKNSASLSPRKPSSSVMPLYGTRMAI